LFSFRHLHALKKKKKEKENKKNSSLRIRMAVHPLDDKSYN